MLPTLAGADPDAVMDKLYYLTELENTFDCNFNILVNGSPRQMGIIEILSEWIVFRLGCMRREMTFDLGKKEAKLHLLLGLATILLDIDKAIAIIRERVPFPHALGLVCNNRCETGCKHKDLLSPVSIRNMKRWHE